MGFIESASTVNVEATLTREGKKRLYQLIEGDANFITRFTLGDSDTDYQVVSTAGPLDSGHVPETGDFRPVQRSYILYDGVYRPGLPVIYINNVPNPSTDEQTLFSIGGNSQGNSLSFDIHTEWPKTEQFAETYEAILHNPGQISESVFNRAFSISPQNSTSFELVFNGNLSLPEISALIGESNDSQTDIAVEFIGNTSRSRATINIALVI